MTMQQRQRGYTSDIVTLNTSWSFATSLAWRKRSFISCVLLCELCRCTCVDLGWLKNGVTKGTSQFVHHYRGRIDKRPWNGRTGRVCQEPSHKPVKHLWDKMTPFETYLWSVEMPVARLLCPCSGWDGSGAVRWDARWRSCFATLQVYLAVGTSSATSKWRRSKQITESCKVAVFVAFS